MSRKGRNVSEAWPPDVWWQWTNAVIKVWQIETNGRREVASTKGTVGRIPSHININIYMQLLFITMTLWSFVFTPFRCLVACTLTCLCGNYDWLNLIKRAINFNYVNVKVWTNDMLNLEHPLTWKNFHFGSFAVRLRPKKSFRQKIWSHDQQAQN